MKSYFEQNLKVYVIESPLIYRYLKDSNLKDINLISQYYSSEKINTNIEFNKDSLIISKINRESTSKYLKLNNFGNINISLPLIEFKGTEFEIFPIYNGNYNFTSYIYKVE